MKINANSIRIGNVLEYNNKLYIVSKTPEHTMPGKGGAFIQVEMKEARTDTKVNVRFRSNEEVEKIRLDEKEYQYLYSDDSGVYLMDTKDFEQIQIDRKVFGDKILYLKEEMLLTLEMHEDNPIRAILPDTVIATVEETEPVVKGQTAASSYKPAILENGVRIMVPPFIGVGTRVVVKPEDNSYVERAKSNV